RSDSRGPDLPTARLQSSALAPKPRCRSRESARTSLPPVEKDRAYAGQRLGANHVFEPPPQARLSLVASPTGTGAIAWPPALSPLRARGGAGPRSRRRRGTSNGGIDTFCAAGSSLLDMPHSVVVPCSSSS